LNGNYQKQNFAQSVDNLILVVNVTMSHLQMTKLNILVEKKRNNKYVVLKINKMNPEQLKEFIDNQVDAAINMIFNNAHGAAMTISGDITPEQSFKLSAINEQLKKVVLEQVVQNLTSEQRDAAAHIRHCSDEVCKYGEDSCPAAKPVKQWNVPVMRTGYGHNLIAVSAKTEEEAIELALDMAGGEDFSEKSSEYDATDGAHEIK